ncbi:hypothetical protein P154DRAFT_616245 [Amniculicola lignicola CBS 123094]|uniref:Uncharacterized protein n=1 Tax=Amniculicola lignicola CBS 123094 TaxID=1392246 RepID=A0A6A5WUB7_9PLEO|nr:hypothetical protein P154DRAFT_616245 [Amniculicola lignicola CBS 123094]
MQAHNNSVCITTHILNTSEKYDSSQETLDGQILSLSLTDLKTSAICATNETPPESPQKPERWKIVVVASVIVVPMVAFTIVILALVFANQLHDDECPYAELCSRESNHTRNSPYYYVNVPAARLAFVASWSSTIAFSLVSLLMSLFSYTVAWQLVSYSKSAEHVSILPTPYQMSFLVRFLNAEVLAFTDIIQYKMHNLFRREGRKQPKKKPASPILRTTISIFLLGILGSILIQAADTWLHIATNPINLIQTHPVPASTYFPSRGVAPWCLTKPSLGSECSKNWWGCGLGCWENEAGHIYTWGLANMSEVNDGFRQKSVHHKWLDYRDEASGVDFAVVAPANVPENVEWKADSYGVSTTCRPIPFAACDVEVVNETTWSHMPFSCSSSKAGIDINGTAEPLVMQYSFLDFHKDFNDADAFLMGSADPGPGFWKANVTAPKVRDEDANGVFRNPWRWVAAIAVYEENPLAYDIEDPLVWMVNWTGWDMLVLDCETTGTYIHSAPMLSPLLPAYPHPHHYPMTCYDKLILTQTEPPVHDISYTYFTSTIHTLTHTISNGSLAGMISMPAASLFSTMPHYFDTAVDDANRIRTSTSAMVTEFSKSMSHLFAATLSGQLSARPSPYVQKKVSILVSQMPKAALWTLVVSNLLFAGIGVVLAGIAWRVSGEEVQQIQMRLGIPGLTADVFEKRNNGLQVKSERGLFQENDVVEPVVRRVGVRRTDTGGTVFGSSDGEGWREDGSRM